MNRLQHLATQPARARRFDHGFVRADNVPACPATLGLSALRLLALLMGLALLAALAACGSGVSADTAAAQAQTAQTALGSGHGSAGPAGVVVTAPDGARVDVPPGATRSAYTVTLARDSAGAPMLPERAAPAGAVYKLTPHGAQFALPVQLSLPFDPDSAPPGSRVVVFKADPGGAWTMLDAVRVKGRQVVVFTDSFSYFIPMFVTGQTWYPVPPVSTQAFVAWALGSAATSTLPTAPARDSNGNVRVDFYGDPWPQDTLTIVTQPDATQPVRLTLRAALPANSTAAAECNGAGWEYVVRGRHARFGPTEVDQGGVIFTPVLARLRPPQDGTVASVSFDVNLSEFSYEMDPYGGDSHESWLSGGRILNHPDWPAGLRLEVMGSCVGSDGTASGWLSPVATGGVNLALRRGFPETALAVLQHPADQTVVEGERTTFRVRVSLDSQGRATGALTWQRSFAALPDAWVDLPYSPGSTEWQPDVDVGVFDPGYAQTGRSSLTKAAPTQFLDDQGLFRARLCPVTGTGGGCVHSRPARLTVTRNFVAPQVTLQPAASVTVRENVDNEVAQITATFSGLPQPTVVWQVRQPGAQDFLPVDPATHSVSGATLTIRQRFTLADRGRLYQAVASNGGGVAISQGTTLWVTTGVQAPSITTQPADLTVTAGGPGLLAAAADGAAPLNYQWFFNGQAITGANGPLLALNNVNAANAGTYQLEVRNAEDTVRSRAARLSVTGQAAPMVQAPTITVAPAPQAVAAGSTATFAVVAGGTAPLAYQWRRNGADITGATGPVLSVAQADVAVAGDYSVRVANSAGAVTSPAAALTVQTPATAPAVVAPSIKVQPWGLAVVEGQGATLAVAASGSGPLRYQWFREGRALTDATEAALVFPSLTAAQAGRYTVTVSNDAGSVTSEVATLVVTPPPGLPVIVQLFVDQAVTAGQPANFRATVQGSPAPQCQWTHNGIAILGATDCSSYTLPVANLADQGAVFNLVAYNPAGAVFGNGAVLGVTSPVAPAITAQPGGQTVVPGGTASFTVTATGTPAPTVEWGVNGGLIGSSGAYVLAGCSFDFETAGDTLTLRNVSADCDGTTVVAQLRNVAGTVLSDVVVLAVRAPVVTATLIAGSPGVTGSADGSAGASRFHTPNYLTRAADGSLAVGDFGNSTIRLVSPGGSVSTLAGTPGIFGFADGTGSAARFAGNGGLAYDSAGNLFVSDWDNHVVRRITPAGVVTTFAGSPGVPGSADGSGAAARFRNPNGLAVDGADNVYVVDWGNHTVRRITPAGEVSTFAGSAGLPGSADGTGAAARFSTPGAVAIDGAGNLYVSDMFNHTIRKITPAGAVSTLAGQPGVSGTADGSGSAARFDTPAWISATTDGTLFVVSAAGDTVRRVTPAGEVSTVVGVAGANGALVTGPDPRLRNARGVWAVSSRELVLAADQALLSITLP